MSPSPELSAPPAYEVGPRSRVRREDRASYDRALVHSILDEGMLCHVAFVVDGQPFVVPMAYGRVGETLYLHGAPDSRLFRHLHGGAPVCVEVALLDGLVLARSAAHHSCNYRSVVVFGRARGVRSRGEKEAAFRAIVDHVTPGRWEDVRQPSESERRQTQVIAVPIEEASAKVHMGPPADDPDDRALAVWAGVVPVRCVLASPSSGDHEGHDEPLPAYLEARIAADHTDQLPR